MPLTKHLVIFGRLPGMRTGKRRLAADIGPAAALAFQRWMFEETVRRLLSGRRWRTTLAITPKRGGALPNHVSVVAQPEGSLGSRMASVARSLSPGPVVIVGTDIPDIRSIHIAKAFSRLGSHDFVFGPAQDGGFWLVGMKRRPIFVNPFRDVRWSTPFALSDTLKNINRYRVALIDTLEDVDDGAAFGRWARKRRRGGTKSFHECLHRNPLGSTLLCPDRD